MKQRKMYDASFQARVALEAIKGGRTLSEISKEYKVHPNQIVKWKKEALSKFSTLFIITSLSTTKVYEKGAGGGMR